MIEARVNELLGKMSSAEKYAQMAQVEKNSITPDAVREYGIGSVLSGGGGSPETNTPATWREMVQGFQGAARQSRLGIPLLYGVDAVHGHGNVWGATVFPHNSGLGATRDAALVEKIGRITAIETALTAIRWNFAPAVSVARDIRWGRTYESYSQDTDLVTQLSTAYLRGLQGERLDKAASVLGSVKHFIADGGTDWGSASRYEWIANWWLAQGDKWQIDQGNCSCDEETLYRVHLPPYQAAIKAGARNIMVSYSSWQGVKMHANRLLLTDWLKGELGFDGFLVTDWMSVDQLSADYYQAVVVAINAGLDMVMLPFNYLRFFAVMARAEASGDIPLARIDDAVRRILRVKFEMGLFDDEGELPAIELMGCAEHRAVAREAVQKSAVLLKNEAVLPLSPTLKTVLVAGEGANDIGLQCGGWTIAWQGMRGAITPGTTILAGLQAGISAETTLHYAPDGNFGDTQAPVALVVVGEQPYTEGEGDNGQLILSDDEIALIERVRSHCEQLVVILLSGRPLLISDQLAQIDALVAAWLPGSEGGDGLADLLLGRVPFQGKLSFGWPRTADQFAYNESADFLWPLGYGL